MGSDRLTTEDAGAVQFLGDDHGQDADRWSASNASVDVDQFFAIYFSPTRFTVETVIAMTSAGINAAVLATLVVGGRFWTHGHHGRTVYRCLFSNLAVADCLSSVSMWLGNNVAYLFGEQLARMNVCLSIICLSAARSGSGSPCRSSCSRRSFKLAATTLLILTAHDSHKCPRRRSYRCSFSSSRGLPFC